MTEGCGTGVENRKRHATMSASAARSRLYVTLLMAVIVLTACSHGEPSGSKAKAPGLGVLTGKITGASNAAQRPGIEIRIVKADGTLVATARSNAHGRYRVTLPAGEYRVEHGAGFGGAATNLPAKVAISRDETTRLDIWIGPGKG